MKKQKIPKTWQLVVLISCTLIACFVIFMNVIFDQALFIHGINFIYSYQTAQPFSFLHQLQNFFSLLCNPLGIGVIALVYYILVNRKLMLIVHLSYFLFATYIIALLKQAFQQSRPIWYDYHIQNWEWFCPKDFGNPSGHSFAVMMLYEPIISDSLGYGNKYWAAFPLFVIGTMVPISRMYLGVHSLNQILFGLTLGFVSLILFKYVYQKALYELYWEMLMKNTGKKTIKIIGIFILNVLCVLIPIMFFELNVENRPMIQKDINNLNLRCGTQMTGYEVQEHILVACAVGCIFFGLLYGFLLLSDTVGYRKYMLGLWQYQSCIKIALKICTFLLCAVPALIILLIGKLFIKDAIAKYLVTCLGITIAGIGLSYWAPVVAQKCHIIKLLPGYAEEYVDEFQEKVAND